MLRRTDTNFGYGGSATAGFSVGILVLDTRHALLPGNVQHAAAFEFPVIYERIGFKDPSALMRGDAELIPTILESARRLEREGVRAIAGACGSFAYYQEAVAAAVKIPVFMSIMMQVPLLQRSLGAEKKMLVVCARASALTPEVYRQCGIHSSQTLVICEMAGNPEFERLLRGEQPMDIAALEAEVMAVVTQALCDEPQIACVLLQCSDLPPFAPIIQECFSLPVFDAVLMIRWLASAAEYLPYRGTVRRAPFLRDHSKN